MYGYCEEKLDVNYFWELKVNKSEFEEYCCKLYFYIYRLKFPSI